MERIIEEKLLVWAKSPERKPLLLDGARQTGKTYLLTKRFRKRFDFTQVHRFDLLEDQSLHQAFESSLNPKDVLRSLELHANVPIDTQRDLIILDEIGECQRALDSLKYFAERMPHAYICATGSNVGLLKGFPVGNTRNMELLPMNFEEFLMASGDALLLEEYRNFSLNAVAHRKLWLKLLDYYYVGGMPEAVERWFSLYDESTHSAAQEVYQIHNDLIAGYERDFGKYSYRGINSLNAGAVFHSVASQLQSHRDGSVQRYKFKGVVDKKKRYAELRSTLDFLEKLKLTARCKIISSEPSAPLGALARENIFKLFLFDIGLLGCEMEISYSEQRRQEGAYKGFFAENFVCNELRAAGVYPLYSWTVNRAEIEFLHKDSEGAIIPIEVKSGRRTQAKSLKAYRDKYQPSRTLKLVGGGTLGINTARSANVNKGNMIWPLHYTARIAKL